MVKKGQAYIIVVLIIAIAVLTIAVVYRGTDSTITGEGVGIEEDLEGEEEFVNVCELDQPFDCSVWEVDAERGEIHFRIENTGFDNYVIRNIQINGCDSPVSSIELFDGSANVIKLGCDFLEGEVFEEEISVFYKKASGGTSETAEGRVAQLIE